MRFCLGKEIVFYIFYAQINFETATPLIHIPIVGYIINGKSGHVVAHTFSGGQPWPYRYPNYNPLPFHTGRNKGEHRLHEKYYEN